MKDYNNDKWFPRTKLLLKRCHQLSTEVIQEKTSHGHCTAVPGSGKTTWTNRLHNLGVNRSRDQERRTNENNIAYRSLSLITISNQLAGRLAENGWAPEMDKFGTECSVMCRMEMPNGLPMNVHLSSFHQHLPMHSPHVCWSSKSKVGLES